MSLAKTFLLFSLVFLGSLAAGLLFGRFFSFLLQNLLNPFVYFLRYHFSNQILLNTIYVLLSFTFIILLYGLFCLLRYLCQWVLKSL